jgi:hypothetical protein
MSGGINSPPPNWSDLVWSGRPLPGLLTSREGEEEDKKSKKTKSRMIPYAVRDHHRDIQCPKGKRIQHVY